MTDRLAAGVAAVISKGSKVRFERADKAEWATSYGLDLAQDGGTLVKQPGHVMGLLAWGHPFLDGNGRTIMVVYAELLRRCGYMIDWSLSSKRAYLEALTSELDNPHGRALDAYMSPLLISIDPRRTWIEQLSGMPGLKGGGSDTAEMIAYSAEDQLGAAMYSAVVQSRGDLPSKPQKPHR